MAKRKIIYVFARLIMRIQMRFSLDTNNDDDIITYLESMSSHARSQLVRNIIRQHIIGDRDTIMDKLNRIIVRLEQVSFTTEIQQRDNSKVDTVISTDILQNLDKIGL